MQGDDSSPEHNEKQGGLENLVIDNSTGKLAADLLGRCEALLGEVETFQQFLVEQKRENTVEIRHFKSNLKAECKSLEKLVEADPEAPRTAHTLRSSNFPFYATLWNVAKSSVGVIALEKRFFWPSSETKKQRDNGRSQGIRHKPYSTMVDIVSRDGSEWIKVSSVTEKRIFFDLAKAGWVGDSSSEEDERSDDEDDNPEGLLKQAEALSKASKATRVRYRHPHIRLVLPKVTRGNSKEVDQIFNKIESLGITVETSEDVHDALPITEVLHSMDVNPFASFSDTLNVDCTVLLALVSDLSHSRVAPEEWHHRAIARQIEMEKEDQLLPNSLWPACGSRPLVCTREAVRRMHEIVDLIGTAAEKKRRDCLVEVDGGSNMSRDQRVKGFQELSAYDVPMQWNLPIVVVEDGNINNKSLPSIAGKVMDNFSNINRSVFLYGWARGLTTISSNRTFVKEVETAFEVHRINEEDIGPDIWLCPTARSLLGKEKMKRNWDKEMLLSTRS